MDKFRIYDTTYGKEGQMINMTDLSMEELMMLWHGAYADEAIIMQFTGITDSKDVDIYEGDIVKSIYDYGSRKGKVEQIASVDRVSPVLWTWGKFRTIDDALTYGLMIFEVIGNIHQNPELLKEVTTDD